jgi:hypothetical protein
MFTNEWALARIEKIESDPLLHEEREAGRKLDAETAIVHALDTVDLLTAAGRP